MQKHFAKMTRMFCFLACVLLLSIFDPSKARAQSDFDDITRGLSAEQVELLRSFRKPYENIKEVYSSLEIDARVVVRVGKRSSPDAVIAWRVKSLSHGGDYFRLDQEVLSATGERRGQRGTEVTMTNPDGFVEAVKLEAGDSFVVKEIGSSLGEERGYSEPSFFRYAAFAAFGTPLEGFLFQAPGFASNYQIDDVAITKADDGDQMIVKASFIGLTNQPGILQIALDADTWVVKAYVLGNKDLRQKNAELMRGRMTYSDQQEKGVPLLSRVETWYEVGPQRVIYAPATYDITSIKPFEGSLAQFSPASIGIDVAFPTPRSYRLLFICLGLGLLFLAAYFFLRKSARTSTVHRR